MATASDSLLADLPGTDLIQEGLADIGSQRESVAALLVMIGSPRLAHSKIQVPVTPAEALDADRRLYKLLCASHGNVAHSQYNALIRQLVSFERALEQRTRLLAA